MCVNGVEISYELTRAVRKTMSLSVGSEGVRVKGPRNISSEVVAAFVCRSADWIFRRQRLLADRREHVVDLHCSEVTVPMLGERCLVVFNNTLRRPFWGQSDTGVLVLSLPNTEDRTTWLISAFKKKAQHYFEARVAAYCAHLGHPAPVVRMSSARTRWGSCSRQSGIRLHWRLIHLEPELADYVVAHEVAHLVHMNHSPDFWSLVEALYPNVVAQKKRFREAVRHLPVFERAT